MRPVRRRRTALLAALVAIGLFPAACGKKGTPRPPQWVRPKPVEGLRGGQRGDSVVLSLAAPGDADGRIAVRRERRPPFDAPARGGRRQEEVAGASRARRRSATGRARDGRLVDRAAGGMAVVRGGSRLAIPISIGEPGPSAEVLVGEDRRPADRLHRRGAGREALEERAGGTGHDHTLRSSRGSGGCRGEIGSRRGAGFVEIGGGSRRARAGLPGGRGRGDRGQAVPHPTGASDVVPRRGGADGRDLPLRSPLRPRRGSRPLRVGSGGGGQDDPDRHLSPSKPEGLAAAAEDDYRCLFWTPSPEVAGYLVYRRDGSGAPFRLLTPSLIPTTTYADTDVRKRTRYTYAVSAVDTSLPPNESARSEPAEESLP